MCGCGKKKTNVAQTLFINVKYNGNSTENYTGIKTNKNYGQVNNGDQLRVLKFDYDSNTMTIV